MSRLGISMATLPFEAKSLSASLIEGLYLILWRQLSRRTALANDLV